MILFCIYLQLVGSDSIHLSLPTLETCLLLPSAARTFEGCGRDTLMNGPITAQQRTSCHAAPASMLLRASHHGPAEILWHQKPPSLLERRYTRAHTVIVSYCDKIFCEISYAIEQSF
ncbi:hypothetical protein Y032_0102g3508 [Ancylostoma ceylanicum]|uniref:Uncharacterized protein n=1 Tax=Ancylostoma ceylanicum TaxID=53326 RepID=A0A016TGQ6_9BILA|nr:hypothetical protein Y032_0102g3508 [Ancylostoma ceylanicum]